MRSVVLLLILLAIYLPARPQSPATNADVQAALRRARMLTDSLANSQKFKQMFKQSKQVNIDSLEKVGRDFSRNGRAAGIGVRLHSPDQRR